ncbi:RNA polymerase sigma factor [Maribacter sp. 2-571]|uniref:RNA polymerase sigma factor n=1 Tax=Maribacter sp. 2-571 TaxID=3417569 RepID=UPI003D33432A
MITDDEKTAVNSALTQLRQEDLKRLVVTVFKKIPPKEAMVLQLYYIDDQNIAEIMEITAFSNSQVKVLLHRGRTTFYKHMESEDIKKPY